MPARRGQQTVRERDGVVDHRDDRARALGHGALVQKRPVSRQRRIGRHGGVGRGQHRQMRQHRVEQGKAVMRDHGSNAAWISARSAC